MKSNNKMKIFIMNYFNLDKKQDKLEKHCHMICNLKFLKKLII